MYTPTEITQLINVPAKVLMNKDDQIAMFDILLKDVNKESFKDDLNKLLAKVPGTVPYTSDDQIQKMFIEADKNGEKDLSNTDKVALRFFAEMPLIIQMIPFGTNGLPPREYNSDGTVKWASDVLKPGMSVTDNLIGTLTLAKSYSISDPNVITEINKNLPTGLAPFASMDDYQNRLNGKSSGGNDLDPTVVWFIKFISVGLLYVAWIAENKWKLDPNWSMPA